MGYAKLCLDRFVRKEFIPVFERWLYFGALRILNRISSDKPLRQGSVAMRRSLAVSLRNTQNTDHICSSAKRKQAFASLRGFMTDFAYLRGSRTPLTPRHPTRSHRPPRPAPR